MAKLGLLAAVQASLRVSLEELTGSSAVNSLLCACTHVYTQCSSGH